MSALLLCSGACSQEVQIGTLAGGGGSPETSASRGSSSSTTTTSGGDSPDLNPQCDSSTIAAAGDAPDPSAPCGFSIIVSGVDIESALVKRGDTLHWANTHDIQSVPLAGGAPVTVAAGVIGETSYYLAVDATSAYWLDGNAVMRVPVGGGQPTVIASAPVVGQFTVDAESVYWIEITGEYEGRVMKAPLGGGAPAVFAPGPAWLGSLAVDAENVYWTHLTDGEVVKSGLVMKAPKAGGDAITIAEQVTPSGVAVDGENVYWSALEAHAVLVKAAKAGGAASKMAVAEGRDPSFAVNGGWVYWFESLGMSVLTDPPGDGYVDLGSRLLRAPIDGGCAEVIASFGPGFASSAPIACPGGICFAAGTETIQPAPGGEQVVAQLTSVVRYNACP